MWGTVCAWIAALCWGCALSHEEGKGDLVKVLSLPGRPVSMPCVYHYEDRGNVTQLSVQWRGPGKGVLCHYIKHRVFLNCTEGYGLSYTPGRIVLTVQRVAAQDFRTHVCSVSKRHEFSDNRILLAMTIEDVTEAPTSGWDLPGHTERLFLLPALMWIMYIV